jgi:hypothetical protein
VASPKLTLARIGVPAGDDRLSFKGTMTFPFPFDPPFQPATNGARVIIRTPTRMLLDVYLPPGFYDSFSGIGWKPNASATGWTYRHPAGPQGIVRVVLKAVSVTPGLMKFAVTGKNADYTIAPSETPLHGTLVVDAPVATTGQCGEAEFPGLPGPACAFNTEQSALRCR